MKLQMFFEIETKKMHFDSNKKTEDNFHKKNPIFLIGSKQIILASSEVCSDKAPTAMI